jgi:hypothetical protein
MEENMKAKIGTLAACLLLMAGLVSAATTIETTWSGSGNIASTVDASGNQKVTFGTGGNEIAGKLTVEDDNSNPYGYGVSTVKTYLTASVSGGGLDYVIDRTKSYTPMYGASGQRAYTSILANSEATVEVATGATSNYASMGIGTYGKAKTTGGYNFQGTGDGFKIVHGVITSDLDGAELILNAEGTAGVNSMSSDISATGFAFGKGQGCYTNANVAATGSGTFQVNAGAEHSMNIDAGNVVVSGPAAYHATVTYGTGLSYGNFALSGN